MATSPDLPTPVAPHPPDVPELPVEPDEGPATPPGNLAVPKRGSPSIRRPGRPPPG
jgi:hypothetical protein